MVCITKHCRLCNYDFTHDGPSETQHVLTEHLDLLSHFPEMKRIQLIIMQYFIEDREFK